MTMTGVPAGQSRRRKTAVASGEVRISSGSIMNPIPLRWSLTCVPVRVELLVISWNGNFR